MKQLITALFILVSLNAYSQNTISAVLPTVRLVIPEWKFPLPYGLYTQQQWKDSCKVYKCPDESQIVMMEDSSIIYSYDLPLAKVLVHQSYLIKLLQDDINLIEQHLAKLYDKTSHQDTQTKSLTEYISNVDQQVSRNTGAINVLDTRTNNLDDKFKLFKKKRKK